MITHRVQDGIARTCSITYSFGLWPVGTLYLGMEGYSIIWSALCAIPVLLAIVSEDRKIQRGKDVPETWLNSIVCALLMATIPMLVLYYIGVAIDYVWG